MNEFPIAFVVARDVLNNLIGANVQDIDNFNWMSQLRYYWKYDDIGMRHFVNGYRHIVSEFEFLFLFSGFMYAIQ